MKLLLLPFLLLLSAAAPAPAEQALNFPSKDALVAFSAPDDWKVKVKNGRLFVLSPDGGDVFVEVTTLEAALDDDAAALKEAKATVVDDFKNLNLTPSEPTESQGLTLRLLDGTGMDDSGPALLNLALLKNPAAKHQILFSIIAPKAKAAAFGAACRAMIQSLRAPGANPPAAEAPAASAHTFTYPDEEMPDFSVAFPPDWKMSKNEEGTYVESPDKLVAINVILAEKSDLRNAEDSLMAKVGDRFAKITWNQGRSPEVSINETSGLTATFSHAQAATRQGNEPYSVNLLSYVRKKGNKVLILLCQNPLSALKEHAAALEAVLQSVKVR